MEHLVVVLGNVGEVSMAWGSKGRKGLVQKNQTQEMIALNVFKCRIQGHKPQNHHVFWLGKAILKSFLRRASGMMFCS